MHILSLISIYSLLSAWAQVEWWLEHRHGWPVKRQWAGSILGWVSRDEYQVLGSTSIPARLDTLVYWEPFSWLTSVGTTRNTVIRLGWSRIGLAVLILHAAGVGLTDGLQSSVVAIINTTHYSYRTTTHTFRHCNTHTFMQTQLCGTGHGNDHGFRGIVCWPWQEESCVIG